MTCDVLIKPSGFLWLVKLGQSGHILEVYIIGTAFPRSIMSESAHNIPVHLLFISVIYLNCKIFFDLLGDPPVDEVEILRGQVKLLHNQLLFERHKCDLHAIRNRRLIGKTFKAAQYQEELLATVSQ